MMGGVGFKPWKEPDTKPIARGVLVDLEMGARSYRVGRGWDKMGGMAGTDGKGAVGMVCPSSQDFGAKCENPKFSLK